jgi:hypothetical protein
LWASFFRATALENIVVATARATAEEQAFRRSRRASLPNDQRLGDHHVRADSAPEIWDFIKKNKFSE